MPAILMLALAFCFRVEKHDSLNLPQALIQVLEKYHYEPKEVNDKLSKELFELYLKRLDPSKTFFLQKDIDSLSNFKSDLDDELKAGNYEFLKRINPMYSARLNKTQAWYKEILSKPFDFNTKSYFDYDEDHPIYQKTDEDLKTFWEKSLKYQVLEKLARKMDIQEKAIEKKDSFIKIKAFDTLE